MKQSMLSSELFEIGKSSIIKIYFILVHSQLTRYPAIPSASRIRMMQRRLKNIRNLFLNNLNTNDTAVIESTNADTSDQTQQSYEDVNSIDENIA